MTTAKTDFYAGSYVLESLTITTETGDQADITNLFVELNIYASIADSTNVVTVTMTDGLNVLTKLPIKGGCFLTFVMTYKEDEIRFQYRVTKVKDIKTDANQRAYTIEAISLFAYESMQHKISKSYRDTTASIALQILKDFAPEEKVLYWEKSRGVQGIVIPNWSPIGTIEWLASRSLAEDISLTDSTFSFYQDSQGNYNFIPFPVLKKIYATDDISFKFIYNNNKTVRKTDGFIEAPVSDEDYFSIDGVNYYDSFDITNAYRSGYFSGTAFNYNLTDKNFSNTNFDFFKDTTDSNLLNSNPPFSKRDGRVDAMQVWNFKTTGLHNGIDVDNIVTDTTSQIYNTLNKPVQSLSFMTKGNPALDIGQIIELVIPSPEPHGPQSEDVIDRSWSGKYYVSAIRNIYNKYEHRAVLDVTKESTDSDVDLG